MKFFLLFLVLVVLVLVLGVVGLTGAQEIAGTVVKLSIAPLVMGALIGGAASLIGGSMASRSAEQQTQMNAELQKEFAQQGVRWRVEDAKKAGLHPLFALGAQTQGFAPGPVIPDDYGITAAGQSLGNAVAASGDTGDRALQKAQLAAMGAATRKDDSESLYWNAQTMKLMQEMKHSSPWPELITDQDSWKGSVEDQNQVYNPYSDAIVRRAHPVEDIGAPVALGKFSGSVENPGRGYEMWSEWKSSYGPIVLPRIGQDLSLMESLEGLDVKFLPIVIAENRRQFGEAGVERIMKLYKMTAEGKPYAEKPGKAPADSFEALPPW